MQTNITVLSTRRELSLFAFKISKNSLTTRAEENDAILLVAKKLLVLK